MQKKTEQNFIALESFAIEIYAYALQFFFFLLLCLYAVVVVLLVLVSLDSCLGICRLLTHTIFTPEYKNTASDR